MAHSAQPHCDNLQSSTSIAVTPEEPNHNHSFSVQQRTPPANNVNLRLGPTHFHRSTSESGRIFRDNFHRVYEEIRPLVEQARSNLLNRQTSQHSTSTETNNMVSPATPTSEGRFPQPSNDYVINVDVAQAPNPEGNTSENITRHNSAPDTFAAPPTPTNNNNDEDAEANDALSQMPEARAILETLQKYFPFFIILSGKAIYDHRDGILHLIALFITFSHANSVLKREILNLSRRSVFSLLLVFFYILVCVCFLNYIFNDQNVYASLLFAAQYPKPLTVWSLLWSVAIADYLVKCITILIKIVVALVPASVARYQKRGKVYLFIESLSQFYRSLLTIQPWLWFLLDSYHGAERVMGVLLSAAYMVAKGADLASRLKLIKEAVHKLIQNVNIGTTATKEQIQLSGSQCPICHDIFFTPVALQPCKHVFCEMCVCVWLDRVSTCPLCRAMVSDDPAWRDGSTTHFIQLY